VTEVGRVEEVSSIITHFSLKQVCEVCVRFFLVVLRLLGNSKRRVGLNRMRSMGRMVGGWPSWDVLWD
jgi:hypothetical protein